MQWLLIGLLLLGILHHTSGALYGIITDVSGDNTQTVVYTVQVNVSTGQFTQIAENLVYIGSSATYDGIAAYDQQKNFLYFSTDFDAAFVYGVDVGKGELLPPVSIGSNSVIAIEWDGLNKQLLITGMFPDSSYAMYTFPYTGASVQMINYTAQNIGMPSATFLDWSKGIYYFVYSAKSQFNLGQFSLSDPTKKIQSSPLNCGSLSPDFLFLDSSTGMLFGIGFNVTVKKYQYFAIKTATCSVSDLGLTGIVTAATYDPTTKKLYLGYVASTGGSFVVTVDITQAKVVSTTPTPRVLEDLQVSFTV